MFYRQAHQRGFIALVSTIVISFILTALLFTVSTSSFYARADTLSAEAKRISLGLAESCVNVALLSISRNYAYDQVITASGGATTTIGTDAQGIPQVCVIKSITVASSTPEKKILDIAVQSEYRDTYSNITTRTTVYNPDVVKVPSAYITVSAIVAPGGAKQPSDFPLFLDGSPIVSGETRAVTPNTTHTVSTSTTPSGYTSDGVWIGCPGGTTAPAPGESVSCSVYFMVEPTTASLTLIANIPAGDNPALFPLTITRVGSSTPMGTVTSGVPTTTLPGSYTLGYSMPAGYTTSGWNDCPGPLSLTKGQIQYCTVTFTKPSVACANTVVMLDRSGSMFTDPAYIADEKRATMSLLDLYNTVTPAPLMAIGRFDDVSTGNTAEIIPGAHLTDVYGTSGNATNTGAKLPGGGGGPQNWAQPTRGLLEDGLFTTSVTNGQEQGFGYFGFSIPPGMTVNGIEVSVNAKATVATTLGVEISFTNGATSTASGKTISLSTVASTTIIGGATDKWGRTNFSLDEFTDGKFIIKLKNNAPTSQTVSVDYTKVRIWYSASSTGLYQAVETGLPQNPTSPTNLSAAIDTAVTELNTVSNGKQKVLILISDGKPTRPTNTTVASSSAAASAVAAKNAGVKIFTIHFGDTTGKTFLASLATDSAHDKGNDSVAENNDGDNFFVSPTSGDMPAVFQQVGSAACTAVLAATQAHLNVVTTVINNDGGIKSAGDFTVSVSGGSPSPSPSSFAGSSSGVLVSVAPGSTITATQTGLSGYFSPYYSGCSSVAVAAGETKTCTIISDDTPAPLPPPENPPPPSDIDIGSWIETATSTP
jgi:hypothetical protein